MREEVGGVGSGCRVRGRGSGVWVAVLGGAGACGPTPTEAVVCSAPEVSRFPV